MEEPKYIELKGMAADWEAFSEEMMNHITNSGKKYRLGDDVEYANLAPYQWAIGDAGKYIFEILTWMRMGMMKYSHPREMIMENLYKAAHMCQIAVTKIKEVPESTEDRKELA